MMGLARRLVAAVAVLAVWAAAPACGQENLEKGKTPAELYASDCAICHKSPRGLVKGRYSLENFLREHYTASRESAAAISAYLRTVDRAAPKARDEPASRRKSKAAKPALPQRKPSDAKSSDDKSEAKPPESKAGQEAPQAAAPKTGKSETAEPKPAVAKTKTPDAQTPGADTKSEKSDKSD
jgi:hypothetical protein